ncbi:hypothetical protein MMC06_003943 [Schaereria dolodes]|nr:hypothetical protein [Schaereria dolodes]
MAVRGQRFHLDLDSDREDEDEDDRNGTSTSSPILGLGFVRDVTERATTLAKPPSPPKFKASETGFPLHKSRNIQSRFKQTRQKVPIQEVQVNNSSFPKPSHSTLPVISPGSKTRFDGPDQFDQHQGAADDDAERRDIDKENKERLSQMSAADIELERGEIISGLSPSLIERLLKRANIDDGRTDTTTSTSSEGALSPSQPGESGMRPSRKTFPKRVTFERSEEPARLNTDSQSPAEPTSDPDAPPMAPPSDRQPVSTEIPLPLPPQIHFPHPPTTPSLDPSDPNFLENLHSKYFPHLPADPSKLAWMAPIPTEDSPADKDSPYNPSQDSLPPSAIRFDFKGRLIPPRLARQIASTKGLHHHGIAPEAAGYTVPELAHLSRSAIAAQRCVAYQTSGRILFRLGRGDFGVEGEELYHGLWKCIEEGRVIDTLVAEAGLEDGRGNRSCKITATEAVWLWRKGGGKRWKAQ